MSTPHSTPSNVSPVTALSPLDGRYASKVAALRPLMSEQGYMHRRVQVEIAWFIALSDAGFAEFKPLSAQSREYLISLVANFSTDDALAIKEEEKVTNHDVKAVEYWIKKKFKGHAELEAAAEFVHFACTSEDINNTSHALMLKAARDEVMLPALDGRYAAKLSTLRPLMSEQGYMHRRVQVEICWFMALSDAGLQEFKPLSQAARAYLLGLLRDFSTDDAVALKES